MVGKVIGLACIAGLGAAVMGAADAQNYIRVGATATSSEDLGEAIGVEAGFGGKWRFLRTELTADMMSGLAVQAFNKGLINVQESDVSSMAAFVSLYLDFAEDSAFKPWVGGGFGGALLDADDVHYTTTTGFSGNFAAENATKFAWHIGAGMSFEMSPGVAVDVGYRYVDLGDVAFTGNVSTSTPGPPAASTSMDASEVKGSAASHQLRVAFRFG